MANRRRTGLDAVVVHFSASEDPRSTINQKHPLPSVLVIALLAVLAGATGPTSIARWAKLKESWLSSPLDLPRGAPGEDVFRRVLMLLKPEAFQACFAAWVAALRAQAVAAGGVTVPVVAIDGKTARRSHDRAHGLGASHCVSAWAGELGLASGQVACAEKSNEITAIPELSGPIDIQGAIVAIDAMGAQKTIAARIVQEGAGYVLALKGNRDPLHQAVIDAIDEELEGDLAAAQEQVTTETGHGREETRTYPQLPAPQKLPGFSLWKGLRSIGPATSCYRRDGKETVEVRYYLSSLAVDVEQFARAVRGHWTGISQMRADLAVRDLARAS